MKDETKTRFERLREILKNLYFGEKLDKELIAKSMTVEKSVKERVLEEVRGIFGEGTDLVNPNVVGVAIELAEKLTREECKKKIVDLVKVRQYWRDYADEFEQEAKRLEKQLAEKDDFKGAGRILSEGARGMRIERQRIAKIIKRKIDELKTYDINHIFLTQTDYDMNDFKERADLTVGFLMALKWFKEKILSEIEEEK